jgi:hypothetical protein
MKTFPFSHFAAAFTFFASLGQSLAGSCASDQPVIDLSYALYKGNVVGVSCSHDLSVWPAYLFSAEKPAHSMLSLQPG